MSSSSVRAQVKQTPGQWQKNKSDICCVQNQLLEKEVEMDLEKTLGDF